MRSRRCILSYVAAAIFSVVMVGSISPKNKAQAATSDGTQPAASTTSTAQTPYRRSDDRTVVNPTRLTGSKIKRFESKRLILYTDITEQKLAASIPKLADALFDHLTKYFGPLPASRQGGEFQATGFLMTDKSKFESLGLLPNRVPKFENGRHLGYEFWANAQDFDYYTRHLAMHEFTHCFMTCVTGSTNAPPPWYMEGMAEYFATHRITKSGPVFGVMPENKKDYEGFGRTTFLNRAVANGTLHPLAKVMQVKPSDPAIYPWSWAACWYMAEHPKYGPGFRKLGTHQSYGVFMQELSKLIGNESDELELRWNAFVSHLVDGYDPTRAAAIVGNCGTLAVGETATFTLKADRGWQSTGVQLDEAGEYTVKVTGQFQVDSEPKPWISEADGVSIRYVRGKRLGCVVGAVVNPARRQSLAETIHIGSTATINKRSGDLYLRINDEMNSLANNSGTASVSIRRDR